MVRIFLKVSCSATILIILTTLIRAVILYKVPKKFFNLLWIIIICRLLIPVYVPLHIGNYLHINSKIEVMLEEKLLNNLNVDGAQINMMKKSEVDVQDFEMNIKNMNTEISNGIVKWKFQKVDYLFAIWLAGFCIFSISIYGTHFVFNRKHKRSIPITDSFVISWKERHKIKRTVEIRQSDEIGTPLTYGILKPVILLTKDMSNLDEHSKEFILMHEFMHIKRFDILFKLFLVISLCVYWFNPFVWIMYILANRDIELACDEAVLSSMGTNKRKEYALILANMARGHSNYDFLYNGFGKNAIEERCVAIMKIKRTSVICTLSLFLVCIGLSVTAFAKEIDLMSQVEKTDRELNNQNKDYVEYVMSRVNEETGNNDYSLDQGASWISEEEYEQLYPIAENDVNYWTADEYRNWLIEFSDTCNELYVEGRMTETEKIDNIAFYTNILNEIEQGAMISKDTGNFSMEYNAMDVEQGTGISSYETILEINEEDVRLGTGK